MIAHSLPDPSFGPAQQLHGATFVVELGVWRESLTPQATVVDIGELSAILADALADLRYRNLDEHPDLAGTLSTTETLARLVAERVSPALRDRGLQRLDVTLREHPDAWAGYTTAL
jgi:6-pyruvoyltetrahydropterin/6-carboxytetrahydropterin synthase